MFDYPRLLGTPREESGIVVQTRLGSDIENFHGPNATPFCQHRFELLRKRYGQNWRLRKEATGGYNCAGLVWASRRVALPNPDDWEKILQEDGYRKLDGKEDAAVGDVVVYRQQDNHEILHVARVCEIRRLHLSPTTYSDTALPSALSKWDLTFGESIHAIQDIYLNGGVEFVVEIYSDRPKKKMNQVV